MSAPIAPANDSASAPGPREPAPRPGRRRPRSAIAIIPTSGASSVSHAKSFSAVIRAAPRRRLPSSLELPQLVDVDRQAPAVHRDDDPEADRDLAGGDDHDDD